MTTVTTDLRQAVEATLDAHVRPALAVYGGAVAIDDISPEGVVAVRLLGACVGCPAADYSMQDLVRRELLDALNGVTDVVLAGSVSDDLLAQALVFLRRPHH